MSEFHPLSVSPWAGLPLPLLTKRCEEEEEEEEEEEVVVVEEEEGMHGLNAKE